MYLRSSANYWLKTLLYVYYMYAQYVNMCIIEGNGIVFIISGHLHHLVKHNIHSYIIYLTQNIAQIND